MPEQPQNLQLPFEALLSTPSIITKKQGFALFEPEPASTLQHVKLSPVSNKLVFGKRMERLFSHYITQSNRYSLIVENLQLIKDKKTIGELDFLIRDNELDQTIHLEIACKFYIYRPGLSPDNMACWIGPNKKDKLVDKLAKLKERQFPLLKHPVTQKKLQELGVDSHNIQQQLFLPGILFTPKDFEGDIGDINPKVAKGHWLTAEQFESDDFSNCQLAIPEKQNWMVDPNQNKDWLPVEKARPLILEKLKNQRSPMVWCKRGSEVYVRFFVLWW